MSPTATTPNKRTISQWLTALVCRMREKLCSNVLAPIGRLFTRRFSGRRTSRKSGLGSLKSHFSHMSKSEQTVIEFLKEADTALVICTQCQRFKNKYGYPPSLVAVNIACFSIIANPGQLCSPITFFQPLDHQREDMRWLMLADANGRFVEFL